MKPAARVTLSRYRHTGAKPDHSGNCIR